MRKYITEQLTAEEAIVLATSVVMETLKSDDQNSMMKSNKEDDGNTTNNNSTKEESLLQAIDQVDETKGTCIRRELRRCRSPDIQREINGFKAKIKHRTGTK